MDEKEGDYRVLRKTYFNAKREEESSHFIVERLSRTWGRLKWIPETREEIGTMSIYTINIVFNTTDAARIYIRKAEKGVPKDKWTEEVVD